MGNQSDSKPDQSGSEEKSTNRHVYVEPGVQIDFVQDLKDQKDSERGEDKADKRRQLFWTKIGSGLVLLYTFASIIQVWISSQAYLAARDQQRPYVLAELGGENAISERQRFDAEIQAYHQLIFDVSLNNEGSSPARITERSNPQIVIGENALDAIDKCSITYYKDNTILAPRTSNPRGSPGITLTAARTPILTDEQIAQIYKNRNYRVAIYGGVKYTGPRGGQYLTQYCYLFVPTGMPIGACGTCDEIK